MRKRRAPAIQEDVVCNLIPMVDIMFLLLLFFMLSADMGQRELEELVLPQGDQVKEDPKEREEDARTTVNVFHRADSSTFNCAINKRGGICRADGHWLIAIRSKEYTLETVKPQLQEEADSTLEADVDPIAKRALSKRKVIIRSDKAAPFLVVQKLIEICGSVGIYKIEVGAALPPKE
jgi:biopolymer transport protein ExbD